VVNRTRRFCRQAATHIHSEYGSYLFRPSQKHNAHGPEIIKVHYQFHPLFGQSLRVRRRMKLPRGNYIFFELPDGTIGGFPSWIADAAKASEVAVGTPLVSAAALAELYTLLDRLRSGAKRDKASLQPVLKERHE
jgi:hypothetical protein